MGKEKLQLLKKKRFRSDFTKVFSACHMMGVALLLLIPLFGVLLKSFSKGGQTFEYYSKVMGNEAFVLAAKNTVHFELLAVPLLLVVSLWISVVVHHWENVWVKYALLLPLAIPSNALALVVDFLFSEHGFLNRILIYGFQMQPIRFTEGQNVFYLLVGIFVWKNIGYNMLIWLSGLSTIPKEIYEAGRVDGASEIRLFFCMTLPNLRGSIFIATVLSVVNSFKVYRDAYVIAGNYPPDSVYMLQHIFNNWFAKLEVNKMAAGAVLTVGFLFLLLAVVAILIFFRPKRQKKEGIIR